MSSQLNIQVKRWGLTPNNYTTLFDYKKHTSKPQFTVQRRVWGFEIGGETNIPHIQGYLEFARTRRLTHVRIIFRTAHWYKFAGGLELQILHQICKSQTLGNFEKEGQIIEVRTSTNLSNAVIIRALLNPKTSLQVKFSKEYGERSGYFDKMATLLQDYIKRNDEFEQWQDTKLYPWQFQCLKRIMEKGRRKVLWVYDIDGDNGRRHFAGFYPSATASSFWMDLFQCGT